MLDLHLWSKTWKNSNWFVIFINVISGDKDSVQTWNKHGALTGVKFYPWCCVHGVSNWLSSHATSITLWALRLSMYAIKSASSDSLNDISLRNTSELRLFKSMDSLPYIFRPTEVHMNPQATFLNVIILLLFISQVIASTLHTQGATRVLLRLN